MMGWTDREHPAPLLLLQLPTPPILLAALSWTLQAMWGANP